MKQPTRARRKRVSPPSPHPCRERGRLPRASRRMHARGDHGLASLSDCLAERLRLPRGVCESERNCADDSHVRAGTGRDEAYQRRQLDVERRGVTAGAIG
ncbi:hypothetical protein HMPREF0970_00667 [Schaalia odontolytica F0309]|uniref:Uncharacterized protein n=1 Tax=Schaalia odontolytica F0309 TaxID=649742 RepID=D4TXK1_9ACTO|nr:hypothetical protein HMPREF0970_00667 [Schaalia odontolytica F0309]